MKLVENHIVILFSLFSVINLAIFFYRDKFVYHKYATASSLYSSDTGKWEKFVQDYDKQELAEAKSILDSLKIGEASTPLKILAIGRMLYQHFHKQAGQPSAQLLTASPLNEYKILCSSDTIKLWCGNFASMMAFFCWAEAVPCRVIEILNPGDHHVLNECYLPETKKWVMTDVTNNNLLLLSKKKESYIDLLTLRDSINIPLVTLQAADGSIVAHAFDGGFYHKYFGDKNPINFYYRVDNAQVYKTSEKIKRYLLPCAWYEEITPTTKGNSLFYIKLLFILLWLISFILLLKQLMSSKSRSTL